MPTTADDVFPGRLSRRHFYEWLLGLMALSLLLMTYWWIFD